MPPKVLRRPKPPAAANPLPPDQGLGAKNIIKKPEPLLPPKPLCICGARGARYHNCPVPGDGEHNCKEWLVANPSELYKKAFRDAERAVAEKDKAKAKATETPGIPITVEDITSLLEKQKSEISQEIDKAIKSAAQALPSSGTPKISGKKHGREETLAGSRKAPRTATGERGAADGEEVGSGSDTDSIPPTDDLLRTGPYCVASMSPAEVLCKTLDTWEAATWTPACVTAVRDAVQTLRRELFGPEADVLAECVRATTTSPKRAYVYTTRVLDAKPVEKRVLASAFRLARGWGVAMRTIIKGIYAVRSAERKGTAFLDSTPLVSIEHDYWESENELQQPGCMGPSSSLPLAYDLRRPESLYVLGLHVCTISPERLVSHLMASTEHLLEAYRKKMKTSTLGLTAWNIKYPNGRSRAEETPRGGGRVGIPSPPGQGRKKLRWLNKQNDGGGAHGTPGPAIYNANGGKGKGGGYKGKHPRAFTPCKTCGKTHLPPCRFATKSTDGSA